MAGLNRLSFRIIILSFFLAGLTLLLRPAGAATRSAGAEIYLPFIQRNNPSACGDILVDTVWTPDEGPYQILCDVVITKTVTLTITAGTEVWLEHPSDDLIVWGGLKALGTQDAPVHFKPTNGTTPGSWGRVMFFTPGSNVLDHVILEYGGSNNEMVYIGADGVQVLNSIVQYSGSGGISVEFGSPLISGTQILSNTADHVGGGIFNNGTNTVIQNNIFAGNSLKDPSGRGGAIYNYNSPGVPIIQNNIFIGNSADLGGAIYNGLGSPIIQNNLFMGNDARLGGGIHIEGGSPVILSNIIEGNSASGAGGGIWNAGTPSLGYNDVWNNLGGNYYNIDPGAHDISADPLLVDPVNGDFHLSSGSPCIDAGDPVNYPPLDFEGDARPNGIAPDIGADEYYAR